MRRALERALAYAMDGAMCGTMNLLQWRHRELVCSQGELQSYLSACSVLSREEFYRVPPTSGKCQQGRWIEWDTPVSSGFPENDRARVRLQLGYQGTSGPTILLLHALMSASDFGYLRVARWFNERGWNTVFPHLPFHYSRTPRGYLNGELAITANMIRNGETLRQGVVELRQLMAMLREGGCTEFGIVGTSFGGWNGALLSFLESDFRFIALIQPICKHRACDLAESRFGVDAKASALERYPAWRKRAPCAFKLSTSRHPALRRGPRCDYCGRLRQCFPDERSSQSQGSLARRKAAPGQARPFRLSRTKGDAEGDREIPVASRLDLR